MKNMFTRFDSGNADMTLVELYWMGFQKSFLKNSDVRAGWHQAGVVRGLPFG